MVLMLLVSVYLFAWVLVPMFCQDYAGNIGFYGFYILLWTVQMEVLLVRMHLLFIFACAHVSMVHMFLPYLV